MGQLWIHEVIPCTYVNGPGARACVWVQGCSLACPGCFNPQTHEFGVGKKLEVDKLAFDLAALPNIDGITISGGEPLQQVDGLLQLLRIIKAETGLSVVIFSGFDPDEIMKMPISAELISLVDVIIAGRYKKERHLAKGLKGSDNQEFMFCSSRYNESDFAKIAPVELVINADGSVTITGVDPPII